jgi:exopolyphosphatase / guanosine-5'-triphosphate,3'-diphosphate pyrophosphatase
VTRVAAIDCGTNSIRLLIADAGPTGQLQDVVRTMRIVRLGEGVDRTGEFQEAALARTFDACTEYREMIEAAAVSATRFIATSASRDVRNRDAFIAGVEERLGVRPEVISGAEEARLSFLGALSAVDPTVPGPVLVVDIGGGSTEFVLGTTAPEQSRSVDIGCVRMTERHLVSDPPTQDQVDAVRADVRAALLAVQEQVDLGRARTLIGLAGTVTTVAAMSMGLATYDPKILHGATMSCADVHRIAEQLIAMPRAERAALGFMHPGRVDVIAGGALILAEICRAVQASHVLVSEHDILDGIALELMSPIA